VRRLGRTLALVVVAAAVPLAAGALYAAALREGLEPANVLVRATFVLQLGFLAVLLVRYLVLLWFAFLAHLEGLHDGAGRDALPSVSVVAPAFNEERMIDRVLASLVALDYPRYEIVVVDDGSTDATHARASAWARRAGAVPIRVLSQRNAGKASALNLGIRAAAGELVLCIDTDSALEPSALRAAVRHFADPAVGAVAGNVKVVNRRNLVTWLQALEYVEGLNILRRAQAFFRLVNVVPGPLGLFRRDAVLAAGGYPTDTYAEDCDLTLLLLARGWKVHYEPKAVVWTEAPERIGALLKQRYRWTRGMLQALRKRNAGLRVPGAGLGARATFAYMTFEAVLWPAANVMTNVFFLGVAVTLGWAPIVVFWWLQLTLLDTVTAIFAIALEDESPALVLLAPVYRVAYVLLVDVCKLLATVEDVCGVAMTWGKLERLGRL